MRRRRFLTTGLASAALLALGGTLKVVSYRYPDPGGLLALSPKQFAVLSAVAARFGGGQPPHGPEVARFLDGYLASSPAFVREDVLQLLGLLEHAPQIFSAKLRRFTELSPDEQDRHLESWAESRIALRRAGHNALRELSSLGIWRDPRTWAHCGYGGPIVPRDYRASERAPIEPT